MEEALWSEFLAKSGDHRFTTIVAVIMVRSTVPERDFAIVNSWQKLWELAGLKESKQKSYRARTDFDDF